MDGETINEFVINKNYDIELYVKNNSTEQKILKKKYRLQDDGTFK